MDEVIFVVKTNKTHDLEYLDELLSQQPQYSKYIPSEGKPSGDVCVPSVPSITQDLKLDWCTDKTGPFDGWVSSWKAVVEPQSIYIKIDDDIVCIKRLTQSSAMFLQDTITDGRHRCTLRTQPSQRYAKSLSRIPSILLCLRTL